MPQAQTLRLQGYKEFLRACDHAGKETKKEVRQTFRRVGEGVQVEWSRDEMRFGAFTASGLRTKVRQRGVAVEQTRRKSAVVALRRPKFGRLQQQIGDQVLEQKAPEVMRALERALDTVADHFER